MYSIKLWCIGCVLDKVAQDYESIVHICKRKDTGHPAIIIMGYPSSVSQVPARIILNRLIRHVAENVVPESQSGRSTSDMIFAIRLLQDKQDKGLVDLIKAFDMVNQEGLWKILDKFGCPAKMTSHITSSMTKCKLGSKRMAMCPNHSQSRIE